MDKDEHFIIHQYISGKMMGSCSFQYRE